MYINMLFKKYNNCLTMVNKIWCRHDMKLNRPFIQCHVNWYIHGHQFITVISYYRFKYLPLCIVGDTFKLLRLTVRSPCSYRILLFGLIVLVHSSVIWCSPCWKFIYCTVKPGMRTPPPFFFCFCILNKVF